MKKLVVIVISIIMCFLTLFVSACEKERGDGKSACKNCGRSSVYAAGFCKSCYKSFHDYTYGSIFSNIIFEED